MLKTTLTTLSAIALIGAAHAQEAQLYEDEPPVTAGFVRFVDATGQGLETVKIGTSEASFGDDMTTDYIILENGSYDWSTSVSGGDKSVEAQTYYTVALVGKGDKVEVKVFEDEISGDPAKCSVLVYNLSGQDDVDLHAASVGADIVADVEPLGSGVRDVNALTVDLELRQGDAVITEYPETVFERKTGMTFIVMDGKDGLETVVLKNAIAKS